MSDENMMTGQFIAAGVHECPTCGKQTQWEGQKPKCWCESLTERIAALEAWKAECDFTAQDVAEEIISAKFSESANHFVHSVSIDDLTASNTKIDWEKVGEAVYTAATNTEYDFNATEKDQPVNVNCAKAAVAEYLRQVKERDEDNFTELQKQFIVSYNPLVVDFDKINKALRRDGESVKTLAARFVLNAFHREQAEQNQVKEGQQ